MVALKIEDQKTFTAGLFIGTMFDRFLVREANVITFNSFTVDGRVRKGYYSDEELEKGQIEEYSAWEVLKPFCFSLIKGNRLPESFRIVFFLSPSGKERFVTERVSGLSAEQVGGLYLNIQYENGVMSCVTGTAFHVFTMDKSLEREWDESVKQFFKKNGIAVSQQ